MLLFSNFCQSLNYRIISFCRGQAKTELTIMQNNSGQTNLSIYWDYLNNNGTMKSEDEIKESSGIGLVEIVEELIEMLEHPSRFAAVMIFSAVCITFTLIPIFFFFVCYCKRVNKRYKVSIW